MVFQSADIKEKNELDAPFSSQGMRIAYNCRSFMSRQYTGIGRYASRLIHALTEIDQDNRYVLYAPKGLLNRKKIVPRIGAPNFSVKVDRFKRGLKECVGKVDIYHALSPEIFNIGSCKIIVTVHDLVYKAFPEGHTQETLRLTDEQFEFFLPKVDRFICCSNNTAEDLKEYFDVPGSQISVVYPGVDLGIFKRYDQPRRARAKERLRQLEIDKPFILFVGTLEPRKNLRNLIRAFAILKEKNQYDGQLVVCGMSGWLSGDIFESIKESGVQEHIVSTGFLPDDDLCALYNLADVFAFPSFYEGFGYPIIEAFSCGAPVVTSDRSSCGEVAGDAALCVNPDKPGAIASAIKQLIDDESRRNDFISRGQKRARLFSHTNCANHTLDVYRGVYES